MMPPLPPTKLPPASEVQRLRQSKAKSLPSLRQRPAQPAAPSQHPLPQAHQLLPAARAAPKLSEFAAPDRLRVLIREDALARTRVLFKPADPAQQRFVTAQHNQTNLFMLGSKHNHHDLRAVLSVDDAVTQLGLDQEVVMLSLTPYRSNLIEMKKLQ